MPGIIPSSDLSGALVGFDCSRAFAVPKTVRPTPRSFGWLFKALLNLCNTYLDLGQGTTLQSYLLLTDAPPDFCSVQYDKHFMGLATRQLYGYTQLLSSPKTLFI